MDGKEKTPSGKTGLCSNCGRKKFIADKSGHCGACHDAVEGLAIGTPEYATALDEVKAHVTDPNFHRGGNRRGLAKKTAPPAQKPKEKKKAVKKFKSARRELMSAYDQYLKGRPEGLPTPIKSEIFQYPPAVIIETMTNQRDYHLAAADKLNRAIDILQS